MQSSKKVQEYFLEGLVYCRLLEVSPLNCEIQVEGESFQFSREALLFLSQEAFEHYQKKNEPFKIFAFQSNEQFKLDKQLLIECFQNLYSLFTNKSFIDINLENVYYFSFLSEKLDNMSLYSVCNSVIQMQNPLQFSLSSRRFSQLSRATLLTLNNFCLLIESEKFECNSAYACCLFDQIFNIVKENSDESFYQISVPENFSESEYISIFYSIFNVLRGCSLIFSSEKTDLYYSISDQLKISILNKVPVTVEESFELLINENENNPYFEIAVSILAKNFSTIDKEKLLSLPISKVIFLFQSESISVPNEDCLFSLFCEVYQSNHIAILLLKYLHLYAVNSDLLLSFINQIPINELTLEVIETIKTRLSFDTSSSPENICPSERWETQISQRNDSKNQHLIEQLEKNSILNVEQLRKVQKQAEDYLSILIITINF